MGKKIHAVLVTFNRLDFLKKSIDALLEIDEYLEKIWVINNASTDGTVEYLDSLNLPKVSVHHSKTNMGGAGGFHHGMRYAVNDGADWVWVMDDDCIVRNDSLHYLVNSPKFTEETGFLSSLVLWKNEEVCLMNIPRPEWNWTESLKKDAHARVSSASFVSTLVNARVIKELGLPVEEFFIWYDDVEFTSRVSKKYPGYLVSESVVHHHTVENKGVNWDEVTDKNFFKYKYGLRNQCSCAFYQDAFGIFRSLIFLASISRGLFKSKTNLKTKSILFYWWLKGFFFNYPKMILKP